MGANLQAIPTEMLQNYCSFLHHSDRKRLATSANEVNTNKLENVKARSAPKLCYRSMELRVESRLFLNSDGLIPVSFLN